MIVLYSKYALFMDKNNKDNKHTRHISRRMSFAGNGEKVKMHKIDRCEVGLQLTEIGNKILYEPDITPKMKYIMVRLKN